MIHGGSIFRLDELPYAVDLLAWRDRFTTTANRVPFWRWPLYMCSSAQFIAVWSAYELIADWVRDVSAGPSCAATDPLLTQLRKTVAKR